MFVPELLSPAGNLDKLKVSINYGATAVYLGGQKFGLRSAADNFTDSELREGVSFAHGHGAKVYVVLNSFLHDSEIEELPVFVKTLEEIGIDAVIVSDLGVALTVSENSNIEIHLSTQSSCLNAEAAKMWKKIGVTRVVLGREVSIEEAARIKELADVEVEMFIHGAMCMSYSGNCVLSNYTAGRDANRGGCAHTCRFLYTLESEEQSVQSFFMSSKDLNGLMLLPKYIEGKIDSLKIEGRMKSHLYAGTTAMAYSRALNYYKENGKLTGEVLESCYRELFKITHREYTEASLERPAGEDTIYDEREHDEREFVAVGNILEVVEGEYLTMDVRSAFHPGDTLEVLTYHDGAIDLKLDFVLNVMGETEERTRPGTVVRIPYTKGVEVGNIVRIEEAPCK